MKKQFKKTTKKVFAVFVSGMFLFGCSNPLTDAEKQQIVEDALTIEKKEEIFKEVLGDKETSELISILSNSVKTELFNSFITEKRTSESFLKLLTDKEKQTVFAEKLTAEEKDKIYLERLTEEEKQKIFSEKLTEEEKNKIFQEKLTDAEKEKIYSEKLTDEEKVKIFNEVFCDNEQKLLEFLSEDQVSIITEALRVPKKNINVVYAVASVPNIISAIDVCGDLESPTIYYQERDICDLEHMPDNVFATGTIVNGAMSNESVKKSIESVKADILSAKAKYPDYKFTLYINDLWMCNFPEVFFTKQGITNFEVKILSDGTASYGDSILGLFDTREEYDAIDLADYYKSNDVAGDSTFAKYVLKLAIEDQKYKWIVQNPEFLVEYVSDDFIKNKITTALADEVLVKYSITNAYKKLSDNQKSLLKTAMRYDAYSELLTPSTGKKGMMIVGSSDSGMGTGKYQELITKLIEEFGTENYDYYYKPHPRWPIGTLSAWDGKSDVDFFAEKNIKEIPAALPSDLTMVLYADQFDCGGYYGSTFITVPESTVKYFFADKSIISTATKPLDKMFEHDLLNAEKIVWIQ